MTSNFFVVMILTFFLLSTNDSIELKKVKINFVNKDIETPYNVSCSNFESFFGNNEFKEKVILNHDELNKVMNFINNVKKDSSLKKEIDVRAKIYLYYSNGKQTTICIDKFDNAVLDNKYVVSKSGLYSIVIRNCEGFK